MQKVRKFEILVEETITGAIHPVEVVADVPVAALIPALVEELHLPQLDRVGNRIMYMLRVAFDGRMLDEDQSLLEAGVVPGTRLSLASYVMSSSAAHLFNGDVSTFYTDDTMPDALAFPTLGRDTSAKLPALPRKRKSTRRAFLALSAAALGVGSVSLGYTMYRLLLAHPLALSTQQPIVHVPEQPTQAPTQAPTMATAQLVFSQHRQPVRAVSWASDGSMLASGSTDAQLLLWDTGGNVHLRAGQGGAIHALAWSPVKGTQLLAVAAGNRVNLLNSLSGAVLAQGNGHRNTVTSLAWSMPQMLVSGALDQRDIVWNTATFRPQTVFTRHTSAVEAVSWAADGQTIASSSFGGVVRVWNAQSGQEVHGYYFDGQVPLRTLAFAPAGAMLAVGGDDGIVRLWNGTVCQQQAQGAFGTRCLDTPQHLQAHTKPIRTLAWSPDGRFLATGGDDGKLVIWYPAQSQTPLLEVQQNASVRSLAWSPDGKMVAIASDTTVTLWQLH